jgi:hypothetical protein
MRDGEGKEVGEQGWVVWFVAVLYIRRCVFIESTWGWCCLKSACFALLLLFFCFALLGRKEKTFRVAHAPLFSISLSLPSLPLLPRASRE